MTQPTFDRFHPFGKSVRIGCYPTGHGMEILPNLEDLCALHGVSFDASRGLAYPAGSFAILPVVRGKKEHGCYLTEAAYAVFMAWVEGVKA